MLVIDWREPSENEHGTLEIIGVAKRVLDCQEILQWLYCSFHSAKVTISYSFTSYVMIKLQAK